MHTVAASVLSDRYPGHLPGPIGDAALAVAELAGHQSSGRTPAQLSQTADTFGSRDRRT